MMVIILLSMIPVRRYDSLPPTGQRNAVRLHENRVRSIVDRYNRFRWCPVAGCSCIIHINSNSAVLEGQGNGNSGETSTGPVDSGGNETTSSSIPQSVVCANGHALCLQCGGEGHAPCPCDHWTLWQVRDGSWICRDWMRVCPDLCPVSAYIRKRCLRRYRGRGDWRKVNLTSYNISCLTSPLSLPLQM